MRDDNGSRLWDPSDVAVFIATLDDLIRRKTAAGRAKDRAEVEILAALRDERDQA